MAEPIYPRGYTKLKRAYSGNADGKPLGKIPLDEPASAFFYVHNVERMYGMTPALWDAGSASGFWTFQIRENGEDNARILFEQSVQFGVVILGAFGGLLTGWFPLASNTTKFKTRICDGQHVPAVVEPHEFGHSDPGTPPSGYPEVPGLAQPFNVRVDRFSIRMPILPKLAESMELWVSANRYGTYHQVQSNLGDADVVNLDLIPLRRMVSLPEIGPLDQLWWRIRAVNETGFTDGNAMRDTWTVSRSDGKGLVAGYQGYLYADNDRATSFYEQYYTLNESAFGGSFNVRVSGDIVMPAYRCAIPKGAYMEDISDYWVGQLANNRVYYSISYKPDLRAGSDSVLDHRTGTIWSFASKNGFIQCARSKRFETFSNEVDSGKFSNLTVARWIKSFRFGATLVCLYGDDRAIYASRSVDEGRTWVSAHAAAEGIPMVDGIKALAGIKNQNGYFLVYGIAVATSIDSNTPEELSYVQGDAVRVLLKESKEGLVLGGITKIKAGPQTQLPVENVIGLFESVQGLLLATLEEDSTGIYRSTDQLATLTKVVNPD